MLSHVSATSIKLFQNCPRRWYGRYVLGHKSETTTAMTRGQAVHRLLEEYLEKGDLPDSSQEGKIASSGLMHLPKPSVENHVEIDIADYPIEGTPAPFKGYVDLYVTAEQAEDGIPEILDHKTTSNFKYALTASDLQEDAQMLIYAAHILHHVEGDEIRLTHVVYSTKAPYQSQHTSTVVTREHVLNRFDKILEIVQEMVAASEQPAESMQKNNSFCWSYGRKCPFHNECQRTINHAGVKHMSQKQLSVIDKLRGTATTPAEPVVTEVKETKPKKRASRAKAVKTTTIYVNCSFIKGDATSLSTALAPLVERVCKSKNEDHIDLIPYMSGYALLSSLIATEGLPAGEYHVEGSSNLWSKCSSDIIAKADRVIVGH